MKALPLVALAWAGIAMLPGSLFAEEYEDYLKAANAKAEAAHTEWLTPGGLENKTLTDTLVSAAVEANRADFIEEVAAGGNVAAKEIRFTGEPKQIGVTVLSDLGPAPMDEYSALYSWVIRRMTADRFEVWLPKHGWLFNEKGQLLHEARPPRRDGHGRQWYGAFLPDGRWVTTDLEDTDRTLSFFSAKGRLLFQRTSKQLAPLTAEQRAAPAWTLGTDLLAWGRCDRDGKGFVVSIGSDGGRALVYVTPKGKSRLLTDPLDPWKLCYPRDLEAKGNYTTVHKPSDDATLTVEERSAAHGSWVDYPLYLWRGDHVNREDYLCIPFGDRAFGFLPGSHDLYFGAMETTYTDGAPPQRTHLKTWFFTEKQTCRGWIAATYLTDAPTASTDTGAQTWYAEENGNVLVLDAELKPIQRIQWNSAEKPLIPEKLFPDLHLGLFRQGNNLILASWEL